MAYTPNPETAIGKLYQLLKDSELNGTVEPVNVTAWSKQLGIPPSSGSVHIGLMEKRRLIEITREGRSFKSIRLLDPEQAISGSKSGLFKGKTKPKKKPEASVNGTAPAPTTLTEAMEAQPPEPFATALEKATAGTPPPKVEKPKAAKKKRGLYKKKQPVAATVATTRLPEAQPQSVIAKLSPEDITLIQVTIVQAMKNQTDELKRYISSYRPRIRKSKLESLVEQPESKPEQARDAMDVLSIGGKQPKRGWNLFGKKS